MLLNFRTEEVTMSSSLGQQKSKSYVAALLYVYPPNINDVEPHLVFIYFSLNIPASNCAILQKGDDLELLPAGQHYITNPNVTLRGMYTLGENQFEMPTKDM